MALIDVIARGNVAALAAPIGARNRSSYQLFCCKGAAFTAKDDTSACPHDMRRGLKGW